jgi:Na+/H+ antiporter NhaA
MANPTPGGNALTRLIQHEAFAGVLMILAAVLALIFANTGLSGAYYGFLNTEVSLLINGIGLTKPLLLWINDGLMAMFFFLIGLELKREMVEGRLKNPRDVMLPGVAAIGGMGHSGGHRHCLCGGRAGAFGQAHSLLAQDLPADAGHPR